MKRQFLFIGYLPKFIMVDPKLLDWKSLFVVFRNKGFIWEQFRNSQIVLNQNYKDTQKLLAFDLNIRSYSEYWSTESICDGHRKMELKKLSFGEACDFSKFLNIGILQR